MTDRAVSVGYVGLGNLGVHLAASLLRAGHTVTVTDLHPEAAAPLLAAPSVPIATLTPACHSHSTGQKPQASFRFDCGQ